MWVVISIFLFLRPFICGLAFKEIDLFFSTFFTLALIYSITRKKLRSTPYDKIIFIFILSLIISCFFSIDYLNSLANLYKYSFYIALFYFFLLEKDRKKYIPALVLSGIFLSLYSLRAFFIIFQHTLSYLDKQTVVSLFAIEFLSRKRAFSPFVSPNLLGGYLAMVIPISISVIFSKIKEGKKDIGLILSVLCLVVCFAALFLTKSVGAGGSLLAAFILYFIFTKKLSKQSIIFVLILVVLLTSILFIRCRQDKEFITPSFSLKERLSYSKETLSVISRHPLTGVGIGNFRLSRTVFTHNSYLQVWAETGILGIVSWLGLILFFFKEGIGKLKETNRYWLSGFFIAGIGFLIHNFVDFSFYSSQVSFLWWIALGVVLGKES